MINPCDVSMKTRKSNKMQSTCNLHFSNVLLFVVLCLSIHGELIDYWIQLTKSSGYNVSLQVLEPPVHPLVYSHCVLQRLLVVC